MTILLFIYIIENYNFFHHRRHIIIIIILLISSIIIINTNNLILENRMYFETPQNINFTSHDKI